MLGTSNYINFYLGLYRDTNFPLSATEKESALLSKDILLDSTWKNDRMTEVPYNTHIKFALICGPCCNCSSL